MEFNDGVKNYNKVERFQTEKSINLWFQEHFELIYGDRSHSSG